MHGGLQVMAYGYARGRSPELDPREIAEDAARAAGLSVEAWLDRAMEEERDRSWRRRQQPRRRAARDHDEGRPQRHDGLSEDRVSRILDDALAQMQDRLAANEARTASAIAALSRVAEPANRVRGMMSDLEEGFRRAPQPEPGLARQLEERISNVVNLIEERAKHEEPRRPAAEPRDLRQPSRGLERQVAALGARMDAFMSEIARPRADDIAQPIRKLQEEIARLNEQRPFERRAEAPVAQGLSKIETHMAALGQRLDAMAEKVAALRPAGPRDLRAQKGVEAALDELKRLARQGGADESGLLEAMRALDQKLDALSRTPAVFAARLDRLDALEQKLDAVQRAPAEIASRLDDIRAAVDGRAPAAPSGIEAAIETLADRVERLQRAPTDPAIERLQGEIQALGRKLERGGGDSFAAELILGIETKLDALQKAPVELARRLDAIQSLVQERAAAPAGVEGMLRELAQRLEGMQAGPADDGALDRLHRDIRVISQKLESSPIAQHLPGAADLGGLERSITGLFGQLEGLRAEVGATAEQAARRAASEAAADPAMRQQLTEIQSAQQEAERRANATLGAVHETLKRVVERLVDLEADVKRREAAPAPQPSLAAMAPTAAPLPALGAAERPADGSVAGLRAQRLGVPMPAAAETGRGGIGGMFAAAKGAVSGLKLGKGQGRGEGGPEPAIAMPEPPQAAPVALDLPLEPGSGRPRPGSRMPAAEIEPPKDLKVHDPKAQFLAAARRAAQVAAAQSAEALAEPAADSAPGKKRLSKKQLILLGLTALVVALGATLQVMQASPPPAEKTSSLGAIFAKAPTAPREVAPTAAQETMAREAAQQTAAAPRQILPPAPDSRATPLSLSPAKPDDRVMTQPPRAAQGSGAFLPSDPATVGSISPDAAKAPAEGAVKQPLPPVSGDPLLRFEGVAGAERLKAAARAGDPSAFIELGNRHLEGKGAPRDPKTAALWFERAADFGSAPAQFRLGGMYREGRGVERDARLALKHFQAAAEAGNARAMYNAAVLLAEGVNGSPDYAGAGEWFKRAAEFGIRDSQYNLAILYARGLGLGQDLMASYAWFSAAAAGGDDDAGKKRDEVGARLAPEKLAQAKAAAAAWKPKTPDPASNEVPVPSGGWDAAAAKQVPAAALPKAEKRI